jgi:hypothetical protein
MVGPTSTWTTVTLVSLSPNTRMPWTLASARIRVIQGSASGSHAAASRPVARR